MLGDLLFFKKGCFAKYPLVPPQNRPCTQYADHRPAPVPKGRTQGMLLTAGSTSNGSLLFQDTGVRPRRRGSSDVDSLLRCLPSFKTVNGHMCYAQGNGSDRGSRLLCPHGPGRLEHLSPRVVLDCWPQNHLSGSQNVTSQPPLETD